MIVFSEGRVNLKVTATSLGANRIRRNTGPTAEPIKVPFTLGPLSGHAILTGLPGIKMGDVLEVDLDLMLLPDLNQDLTLASILKALVAGLEFE